MAEPGTAFHGAPAETCSGKFSVTVQPLIAVVPLLVIETFIWNDVPTTLAGVAVQVYAANA